MAEGAKDVPIKIAGMTVGFAQVDPSGRVDVTFRHRPMVDELLSLRKGGYDPHFTVTLGQPTEEP